MCLRNGLSSCLTHFDHKNIIGWTLPRAVIFSKWLQISFSRKTICLVLKLSNGSWQSSLAVLDAKGKNWEFKSVWVVRNCLLPYLYNLQSRSWLLTKFENVLVRAITVYLCQTDKLSQFLQHFAVVKTESAQIHSIIYGVAFCLLQTRLHSTNLP